jgi:hypothetical protein
MIAGMKKPGPLAGAQAQFPASHFANKPNEWLRQQVSWKNSQGRFLQKPHSVQKYLYCAGAAFGLLAK